MKAFSPVAVGTPNRLGKLVDIGALDLSQLQLLIIDMKKDEVKNVCMLDMKEMKNDFMHLYGKYIHTRVIDNKCNICMI